MTKSIKCKSFTILFNFICYFVLCINFIYLVYKYFTYPVIIKVAPYTPIDLVLPKLSLCFSLSPLMAKKSNASFFYPFENVLNRTVGSLKESTPDLEDALGGCSIRDWDVNELRSNLPMSECIEYFKLTKYRMHGYMCYKFEPPQINYTLFSILHTLDHHRLLYEVAVSPPLNAGYKMSPLLHFGQFPFHDQFYGKEYLPPFSNTTFSLSYISYELNRLEPPYQTRCRPTSEPECFAKCFVPHYRKFGLVRVNSFPGLEEDSLLLPDFSSRYKGKHHEEIRAQKLNACHEFCGLEKECKIELAVTSLSYESNHFAKLLFKVQTIHSPSLLMKVSASYEYLDLFTHLISLAGCWVGFSILGLSKCRSRKENFKNISNDFWTDLSDLSCKSNKILFIRSQLQRTVILNESEPLDLFSDECKRQNRLRFLSVALSCVLMLIILSLFSIQVVNVMSSYFSFKTKTVISFEIDPRIPPPNIDICFPSHRIIDTPARDAINFTNYDQILTRENQHHNFSLSTLVSKSPKPEEIISACRLRSGGGGVVWSLRLNTVEVCKKNFNFTRYYSTNRICYHFEPLVKIVMGQVNKKWEWHMPGVFYTLALTPKVSHLGSITYALTYEKPPEVSMEFAHSDFNSDHRKMLILTTYVHEQHLLGYPYDTKCDPALKNKSCTRKCLVTEAISKLNRLPYSQAYTENFLAKNPHLHLLTYSDLKRDQKLNKLWMDIETKCDKLCDRSNCIKKSIKTLASYRQRSLYEIELVVDAKESPDITAETFERMGLFDLYYQLICCVNFWLGFSVINSNPHLLINQKRVNRIRCFIFKRFTKIKSALKFLKSLNVYLNLPLDVAKLARKIRKDQRKQVTCNFFGNFGKLIIRIICILCCSYHLYISISAFLMYPTVMNIYSETSTNASHYSLTICISMVEKFASELNIEPQKVAQVISKFTAREILDKSPNISDFLIDCEERGLRGLKGVPNEKSFVENRIFFVARNESYCRNIFDIEKYLFNGLICYVISQKYPLDLSRVQMMNVLNFDKGIFSVFINMTFLTRKYTVIVGRIPNKPYYSGLWSRVVVKAPVPSWHDVSYIGYSLKTLPAPFQKDGYWEPDTISCINNCMIRELAPHGKAIFGFRIKPHVKFLSLSERKNATVQRTLKKFRQNCKESCQQDYLGSFFAEKKSFRVTQISRPFLGSFGNSTGFFLRGTEYPKLSVIFWPSWKLPELLINLGSILGIWFGISAVQLNSLFQPKSNTKLDELVHLKNEFNRLLKDFDSTIQGHV